MGHGDHGTAPFTDAEVLGAAYAFEQASEFRRAPGTTPALDGEPQVAE